MLLVPVVACLATVITAQAVDSDSFTHKVTTKYFQNLGGSGKYQKVTEYTGFPSMTCPNETVTCEGAIAPFNEEVTFMVRGPMNLKEFAFYNDAGSAGSKAKRDEPINVGEVGSSVQKYDVSNKGHAHGHKGLHAERSRSRIDRSRVENEKRAECTTATVSNYGPDDLVETWTWGGPACTADAANAVAPVATSASTTSAPSVEAQDVSDGDGADVTKEASSSNDHAQPQAAASSSSQPTFDDSAPSSQSWTRQAYYSSNGDKRDGLTFLTSSYTANLAHFPEDPSCLPESEQTYSIWSSTPCTGSSCGLANPSNTFNQANYHGFAGTSKAFAFTFSMPNDQTVASKCGPGKSCPYQNPNSPAIWLLNSQIPRVAQFGCNCKASGCGEFDLFEVIYDASEEKDDVLWTKLTSTLYGMGDGSNNGTYANTMGDQGYFDRPFDADVTAIVVLQDHVAAIRVLPETKSVGDLTDEDFEDAVQKAKSGGSAIVLPGPS